MACRTASTASPSTWVTGGSTSVRAIPNRCSGSTSKPTTALPATRTPPRCSRSCAPGSDQGREIPVGDPSRDVSGESRRSMALDPKLLEILACPEDKGPLLYFEDESSLYNPRLKRRYAVRDDIPIMLIDEAETVDDAEHDRLVAKADTEGVSPTFEG